MYKFSINGGIFRKADNAAIPQDPANADWREYQKWLAKGNTPDTVQTVDEAKISQWKAIKAERDRLTQTGGYPLDGYWFHSDSYSFTQQQGLILSAMQAQAARSDMDVPLMAAPWQVMGGVSVVMTASLALRLLPAAMAQQVVIFEAAKAHKAALDACADPANYNFSGGWPQVFIHS